MKTMKKTLLTIIFCLFLAGQAFPAANVYYSVCPYGTGDIKAGSPTITISSGVATLSVAQTGNIGQGCRITYNTTSICYISLVNSSTSFNVVTTTGGTPSNVSEAQTVNSIAHEYASINAAEAGASDANHINNTSLTAADVVLNIACYYDHDDDTADSTAVTIDGYTTDSTRYIRVFTPTGGTQSINSQRHAGKWSTGKYRLATGNATALIISDDYVRIEGLQISTVATSNGLYNIQSNNTCTGQRISECVVVDNGTTSKTTTGIMIYSTGTAYIFNNVVYNFLYTSTYAAIYGRGSDNSVFVYNNTVYGSSNGIRTAADDVVAKNNAVFSCTDDFNGTFSSITNCASDDGDGTNAVQPANWANVFVDYTTYDFHLKSTDTDLIGAGADDPGSGLFSADIDGETRSDWDIGADEYVSGAAPPRRIMITQ